MDRSKDIEQCCRAIRADLAELLRVKRRKGDRAIITAQEQRDIITLHSKRIGIDISIIQNIIA